VDTYLTGVKYYNSEFKGFHFSDGSVVNFNSSLSDANFKTYLIEPSDSVVKTVKIRYNTSSYAGSLEGIELLDKDNNTILNTKPYGAASTTNTHTVELEEGERIIGFKSGRGGSTYAMHYNFQLIIGRPE
jgi:hypothetical protein